MADLKTFSVYVGSLLKKKTPKSSIKVGDSVITLGQLFNYTSKVLSVDEKNQTMVIDDPYKQRQITVDMSKYFSVK